MEFGEWVRDIRQERGLDIRTFAELTGVDSSTVSRIENLHTQAMVLTAFRICEGLEVLPEELLNILEKKQFSRLQNNYFVEDKNVTNLDDIEEFISKFKEDEASQIEKLAEYLNVLAQKVETFDVHEYTDEYTKVIFTNDIARFLFNVSPLFSPLEIKYPRMDADNLLFVYKRKGALMPGEAEVYANKVRAKGRSRLPFGSPGVGMRSASLDRARFSDVVRFDIEMEQEGVVLGMYWESCRFFENFRFSKKTSYQQTLFSQLSSLQQNLNRVTFTQRAYKETRLAEIYLKIYRWFQFLNGPAFKMDDK